MAAGGGACCRWLCEGGAVGRSRRRCRLQLSPVRLHLRRTSAPLLLLRFFLCGRTVARAVGRLCGPRRIRLQICSWPPGFSWLSRALVATRRRPLLLLPLLLPTPRWLLLLPLLDLRGVRVVLRRRCGGFGLAGGDVACGSSRLLLLLLISDCRSRVWLAGGDAGLLHVRPGAAFVARRSRWPEVT